MMPLRDRILWTAAIIGITAQALRLIYQWFLT
jgi:hypothetical protein